MSINAEQFLELLKISAKNYYKDKYPALDDEVSDGDLDEFVYDVLRDTPMYGLSLAEQHGGEGEGDDYYYVVKYKEQFFKIPGYWASYDGSTINWDDIFEVKPVEKVITVYEKL